MRWLLAVAFAGLAVGAASTALPDLALPVADGSTTIPLRAYAGKTLLVVNLASY